jgi:hypothetical protein
MTNTQLPSIYPTFRRDLCGSSSQPYLRWKACSSANDNIRECDACSKPSAKSFQYGFFCCEPASQTFNSFKSIANFVEFFLNKASRDQGVTRIFDPAPNKGDVDQINPMSNNCHFICQFLAGSLPSHREIDNHEISTKENSLTTISSKYGSEP